MGTKAEGWASGQYSGREGAELCALGVSRVWQSPPATSRVNQAAISRVSQVFYIHTHLSIYNSEVILYMNIRDCGLSRRWEA